MGFTPGANPTKKYEEHLHIYCNLDHFSTMGKIVLTYKTIQLIKGSKFTPEKYNTRTA